MSPEHQDGEEPPPKHNVMLRGLPLGTSRSTRVASPASLRDVAQFGGQFWRIVARNYEGMNESAPEGHTTVVLA